MKHTLLATGILLAAYTSNGQTPVNRNQAIVQKATATWCGPCGQWGWETQEQILGDNMPAGVSDPKAFVFSQYDDDPSSFDNTANTLNSWADGFPNWAVNNKNRTAVSPNGGIYPSITRTDIKTAVDSFALLPAVASTGLAVSFSGNTATVNTVTKFWQAGTGNYTLSLYVIEDSVLSTQNGQSGSVYHHNVLRGHMGTQVYGESIVTGSAAMGSTYNKTFTMNVPATWNKSRLKMLAIVWKEDGQEYRFINSSSNGSQSAGIGNIEALDEMVIAPNPAAGMMRVSGIVRGRGDMQLSLTNAIGQTVYRATVPNDAGQIATTIDLSGFSNGLYTLSVSGQGTRTTRQISVMH